MISLPNLPPPHPDLGLGGRVQLGARTDGQISGKQTISGYDPCQLVPVVMRSADWSNPTLYQNYQSMQLTNNINRSMRSISLPHYLPLLLLSFFPAIISAQNVPPPVEWTKTIGGSRADLGTCIIQTADSGYLLAGTVESNDGDVHGMHFTPPSYMSDIYLTRLQANGDTLWTRTYGGIYIELFTRLRQTNDGGYIFTGSTASMDGDVSGLHGTPGYNHAVYGYTDDMWVVRVDALGNIIWQKCLGGTGEERGHDIVVNADGTFLIAGITNSMDGDVSGLHTAPGQQAKDMWVVKLSAAGAIMWQHCYGGTSYENNGGFFNYLGYLFASATPDGGYIFACTSYSSDGDVSVHYPSLDSIPNRDIWLVKIDSSGAILWERSLGGSRNDVPSKLLVLQNGYLLAGITQSVDGDVIGHYPGIGANDLVFWDAWVASLDLSGNILWSKCYGGSSMDEVRDMIQTDDGHVLLSGQTYSTDGDVGPRSAPNFMDAWLFKIDLDGNLLWSKTYGGSLDDDASAVIQTADGGYAFVGAARSPDGDVGGVHGTVPYLDIWVVKLGQDTLETADTSVHVASLSAAASFHIYPTYSRGTVNITSPEPINEVSVLLSDVLGRSYPVVTQAIQSGKIQVDLSQLPAAGCYFIHCITKGQRQVQKVFYQP